MPQRVAALRRIVPRVLMAVALASTAAAQTSPHAPVASSSAHGVEVGMPILESHSYKEFSSFPQIWTVLQDGRGVMYVGVSGGEIAEYDGVSWRSVETGMDITRSLALDDTGRVWVGGNGGFGYLAPNAKGTETYVSLLDKVPQKDRDFTDVWQTLVTPQGIFFRSYEELFRWDGKTMHIWHAPAGSRIQALSMVRGRLYTSENGIGLEEIVGDELRPMPGGAAYAHSIKLFLHPYDDGRILVSERDGLLSLYDGQKATPFSTQADGYLKTHKIYTSTLLRDGSICLTTLNGGAVILTHDGKLRQVIDVADGLLDPGALTAYQDRDGALWIGTTAGVSRVEIGSPVSIFSRDGPLDAIRFQGTVYVADGGGSSPVLKLVSDPRTNRPSMVPLGGATQGFSLLVFRDRSGKTPDQLLVSTSEGLMRLVGDRLTPVLPSIHGLDNQAYVAIQSRKNPSRVFIGHGDGVSSMRWDGSKWIDEGRVPNTVYVAHTLAEDNDGDLWAGGGKGHLLRIKVAPTGLRDSRAESISTNYGIPAANGGVSYVLGDLYAGIFNSQNIYRWDRAAGRFVVDNRLQLPVDSPSATAMLYQTDDGSVWTNMISSGIRRIARVTKSPDGTLHVDEKTYKPLTIFKDTPTFVDRDGSVWSTGDLLIRFDQHLHAAEADQLPAMVRQVNAGSSLIFGGMDVHGSAEVRLPAGSSSVRFQFAAPIYSDAADVEYQYILDGADRDWSGWGKQKEANYSGLGPGKYLFHVRARGFDGRIGPEGTYAFIILPPWYRTTLAYTVYVLLLMVLGVLGWRFISRHEQQKARRKTEALEAQARVLEATVNERTEEIRAQAAEISAQKDSIELLSEIGKEITASLDLNTILFKLYERVNQIVDASIFGVGLYRPEKHLIEYSLAIENGKRYAPYTRSMDDKNQFAVWCIDHRQSILINDVATESSKYIPEYSHTGGALDDGSMAQPPVSMIYLPLVAQERVLGILSVQSFKKNAYTEQHLSLLANLAAYTTIALDNANAYQTINQREQEVRERA
ncbi:MAG TPA: GAF domain-containing protein, partial [Terracidiphilus sp.]|nr:GAF domain-containing protein [Terracidiphilus sp.]